jgi:hypothetical protein
MKETKVSFIPGTPPTLRYERTKRVALTGRKLHVEYTKEDRTDAAADRPRGYVPACSTCG